MTYYTLLFCLVLQYCIMELNPAFRSFQSVRSAYFDIRSRITTTVQ